MFSNIGGLEVLFVLLLALVVLGPTKLPEAARQAGKVVGEIRRISNGFQREFREAIQEPIAEAETKAREAMQSTKFAVSEPFKSVGKDLAETAKAAEAAGPASKPKPVSEPEPEDD